MSRLTLFFAMVNRREIEVQGITGIIQSIQMEDGSGTSFNVQIDTGKGIISAYTRTTKE